MNKSTVLSICLNVVLSIILLLVLVSRHQLENTNTEATKTAVFNLGKINPDKKEIENIVLSKTPFGDLSEVTIALRNLGMTEEDIKLSIKGIIDSRISKAVALGMKDKPFWKRNLPEEIVVMKRDLQIEGRSKMIELFGAHGDLVTPADAIPRYFGPISQEKAAKLEQTLKDYNEMLTLLYQNDEISLLEQNERGKLIKTERDKELSILLNKDELIEYNVRNSSDAILLSRQLRGVDVAEEVYRNMYNIMSEYEKESKALSKTEKLVSDIDYYKKIRGQMDDSSFFRYLENTDEAYYVIKQTVSAYGVTQEQSYEVTNITRLIAAHKIQAEDGANQIASVLGNEIYEKYKLTKAGAWLTKVKR